MTQRFRRTSSHLADPLRTNRRQHSRRFSVLASARSTALASPRRALSVEPLEDRMLLSVTTAYVAGAADFTDTSAPANQGNPQAGDTVTWNGGGQFAIPVPGLIFGTNAFTSINTAVANVSSGGTVDVAPGTYDEHEIAISLPITLNGPNFGVNPNTGTRSAEATIDGQLLGGDIAIGANDVTVNGFTIQGGDTGSNAGISMGSSTSGVQVLDNIITNNTIGIYANSNGSSLIQDNLVTGNNIPGPAGGTGIYSEFTNGLVIDSNVFNNQTINNPILFAATGPNVHQNLQVTNNTIDSNGSSAIYAIALDGAVISGNDITTEGTATGLRLAGDDTGVAVLNNSFHNVTTGVAVVDDGYGLGSDSNITLNYNSIVGATTQGLLVDAGAYTGTLDASRNWWGAISGPTIASNVGGFGQKIVDPGSQVAYRPWLIYGTDADVTAPGFQLPTTVPVTSQGDVSAALNDFTLLQNAIGAAAAGQTIDLSGAFGWTEANAAAAYAVSNATSPTNDIRGVALPDGVNNLTITSSALNASIVGGGDSTDGIYNAFLFSAVNPPSALGNDHLTVSDLNIKHFKSGVMLGWNNGGTFDGTLIQDNTITVAADNDNNANDAQGIAIYFWNGQNQRITGNTIDFEANGTRTTGTGARSFGFQDGTTGGNAYDGLSIDHNVFQLLPSAVGGSEVVTGIWENGHNDDNASHITISQNQFLGIQGLRQFNYGLQLSSQTTNMSIDSNTFTDVKYVFFTSKHTGGQPGDEFTLTNNVLTRVGDANGVFLQNVSDDPTPVHVIINWGTNNTVDGQTGIRGLNELSTQATGGSRPSGGATDLDSVIAFGPIPVDFVNTNWGSPGRFTNPLAAPDGTPGPIAYGFNTFTTVQNGVNAVDVGGTTNVLPGTYAENVMISKNLTLTGTTLSPPTAIVQPTTCDGITIGAPATNVTVENLEIKGAVNGINASALTTLTLSNLTLTGNTSGGVISNVTTVDDTPIIGGTGATDTITGSSVRRNNDDTVTYSGVTNLNVVGSDGGDTFDVTPAAATTTISVDGRLPAPPATPGDTLNVVLPGTTNPSLSDTLSATGYAGMWTFGNAMPVNFQKIETVGNNTDLSITKADNSPTPGTVVPGTSLTYTIVVTNNGLDAVAGATVDDVLPVDFTNAAYTATATGNATGFSSNGSGDIHDTVNLPAGSTITYVVAGTVSSSATGTLSNTATVAVPPSVLDTNSANNTATVSDTLFTGSGVAVNGFEFSPLAGVAVATFTYGSGSRPASDFTATINWGDGSTSAGSVSLSAGVYTVHGSHTYTDEGNYSVAVSVQASSVLPTLHSTATILEELLPGGVRGTPDERFISEVYRDFLGRAVDAGGLSVWSAFLSAGNTHEELVSQIESSPEFEMDTVDNLYERYLHRAADPGGQSGFVSLMAQGDTIEQNSALLAGSPEFFTTQGHGTNDGFLTALYLDALGRPVDGPSEAAWNVQLAAGTSRTSIATSILSSLEYHRDVVDLVYEQLLDRLPDPGGLDGWASALASGATDQQISAAIASSDEYFAKTSG